MKSHDLFGTVICATLVLLTSSTVVLGQDDPAADHLLPDYGEDSPRSLSETAVDPSPCGGCCDVGCSATGCCSRWTVSADFLILDRIGSFHQTLVETVPGSVRFKDLPNTPGTEALNAADFRPGFCGGPRLDLTRHGDCGYDLQLSYFQIDGWNSARSVGPYKPKDEWLVMRAPGGFLQTQDYDQSMDWGYATQLYDAELNVRWNPCCRLTMLAGFRWLNLSEDLQGTIVPSLRKSPFWDTATRNNLYGFQLGADWKILSRGRLSIDGLIKAGLFDNDTEETTEVSIYRQVYWPSASADRAAFVGELDLQCKYQVTPRFLFKVGYETMWLQGVALAPAQIPETYSYINGKNVHVQALGINTASGLFFHGATAGLEYAF